MTSSTPMLAAPSNPKLPLSNNLPKHNQQLSSKNRKKTYLLIHTRRAPSTRTHSMCMSHHSNLSNNSRNLTLLIICNQIMVDSPVSMQLPNNSQINKWYQT